MLTEGPFGVRMRAETHCRVALVEPADFRRLAFAQPAVHRRVMQQVAPVMSRIQGIEQNRERLASLGTMAAGLAHELNNPAAAARRAAADMVEAIKTVGQTLDRFVAAGIEREEAAKLLELHHEALAGAEGQTALGALDAADAEDELLDQLEEPGRARGLAAGRAAGRRGRRRATGSSGSPRWPVPPPTPRSAGRPRC